MESRASQITKLATTVFETLVVGGGINGAVAAAALAARGVSTALVDAGDFGAGSSQHSSNLVWGGIKYMENFEFGLVRKLCASRNQLIENYPSSIREIRFLAMHQKGFRHSLLKLYAGTWLYWLIGGGFTSRPKLRSVRSIQTEEPIVNIDICDGGFEYSDAFLLENDARFVFQFVRSAMESGCITVNYVESQASCRGEDGLWRVKALDSQSGQTFEIRARTLVNACGAFVDDHNARSGQITKYRHIFSKGIHLIVDRITPNDRVLTFFADDGRLFFAIPMGDKTCIGTTDTRVETPAPGITDEDRAFVLENINKRLCRKPLTTADIIGERCGVRPLAVPRDASGGSDWLQLSRKHVIETNLNDAHISIFGGKLTDCINVGEELCEEIRKMEVTIPHPERRWFGEANSEARRAFMDKCDLLGLDTLAPSATGARQGERLWRLYGERAHAMIDSIRADNGEAQILVESTDYMACEYRYCSQKEMITKLEDFLRRRTKIELTVRRDTLNNSKGLLRACRILFAEQAEEQFELYFGRSDTAKSRPRQHEKT